jgi:galactitol-specific phosphotransferase system IIB component
MGLGSGLLVRMGVERSLKKDGYEEKLFNVETTDISTAKAVWPDIFVTSTEFGKQLADQKVPVVVVKNLFDEKEIGEALVPVFAKVLEEKSKK